MFSRGFKVIFSENIEFPRRKITQKTFPPFVKMLNSHGQGIFTIIKKPKYLCRHLKSPAINHYRRRPPSTATSIKGIFRYLSNIPGNSIYTLHTPKISCSIKLFPEIAFLKIPFQRMKIHSVYQTSLQGFANFLPPLFVQLPPHYDQTKKSFLYLSNNLFLGLLL